MGCGASAHTAHFQGSCGGRSLDQSSPQHQLPEGSIVVALYDFEPSQVRWPQNWGKPLTLRTSLAIKVLKDDGGDRAYGHPVREPEQRGYFLKHQVEPLSDPDTSTAAGSTCVSAEGSTGSSWFEQPPPPSSCGPSRDAFSLRSSSSSPKAAQNKWLQPPPRARPRASETWRGDGTLLETHAGAGGGVGLGWSPESATGDFAHRDDPESSSPGTQSSLRTTKQSDLFVAARGSLKAASSAAPAGDLGYRGVGRVSSGMQHSGWNGATDRSRETSPSRQSVFVARSAQPAVAERSETLEEEGCVCSTGRDSGTALPSLSPVSTCARSRKSVATHGMAATAPSSFPAATGEAVWARSLESPVAAAARVLDVSERRDDHLMWLVEHAATVHVPDGWTEFLDDDGCKAYYHAKLKRVSRQHPMLSRYRTYIDKLRAFFQRVGIIDPRKVRSSCAVLLNEVLNRVHRELPPVTPELLEKFSAILGIDTVFDHRLARRMKTAVETYAEDQYDIAVAVFDKVDMDDFLFTVRNEQVAVEVFEKPEGTVMCSEIDGKPAVVKCEQCLDFFSLEGFTKVHCGGKRKQHTTLKCEQLVCSVFTRELACYDVDGTLYSEAGYEHCATRNPGFRSKRRRLIGGISCSEDPSKRAEVLCEECADFFCMEAFIELHNHGHRQHHVPLKMDATGNLYRAGSMLSPEETSRLMSRARLARDGGAWLAFRDDQLNTYWYNLRDKITTTQNPYL